MPCQGVTSQMVTNRATVAAAVGKKLFCRYRARAAARCTVNNSRIIARNENYCGRVGRVVAAVARPCRTAYVLFHTGPRKVFV